MEWWKLKTTAFRVQAMRLIKKEKARNAVCFPGYL